MARPLKNNADYFSHDADMRNDIRIKALRRKFGHVGYSIYNMMLETLTDASDFRLKFDELNIEMLSGDFDIDPHELNDVIDYLLKIELMQSESGFIRCFTLENRFESLLSKRKRDRNRVIADENTQSKVKESKVNNSRVKKSKSKEINTDFIDDSFKEIFNFWIEYKKQRKESYKSDMSLKTAYNKLIKLSDGNVETAIKIIEESISNNWAGFFKLKQDGANQQNNKKGFRSDRTKSAIEHFRGVIDKATEEFNGKNKDS